MDVRVRVECEECERGVVAGPHWEEYRGDTAQGERERAAYGRHAEHEYAAWWRERGYEVEDIPPEEVSCSECAGTAVIEKWLPVEELPR